MQFLARPRDYAAGMPIGREPDAIEKAILGHLQIRSSIQLIAEGFGGSLLAIRFHLIQSLTETGDTGHRFRRAFRAPVNGTSALL